VAGVVRQQAVAGLDVINDGEQSKRNFTTYARERLGGIEERALRPGERVLAQIYGRDAAEFPEYFAGRGNLAGREAVCVGPLTYIGQRAVQADIDNFRAGWSGSSRRRRSCPRWPRHDRALAQRAMQGLPRGDRGRDEGGDTTRSSAGYLTSRRPGPGGRLADHHVSVADYEVRLLRIEALNHALRHSARASVCVCWGATTVRTSTIFRFVTSRACSRWGRPLHRSVNPRHDHEWRVWRA
jgi:5-methyltetrahydropteroyltriglutamate--homocysteine methyltransferase